jgi:hypothetical protein
MRAWWRCVVDVQMPQAGLRAVPPAMANAAYLPQMPHMQPPGHHIQVRACMHACARACVCVRACAVCGGGDRKHPVRMLDGRGLCQYAWRQLCWAGCLNNHPRGPRIPLRRYHRSLLWPSDPSRLFNLCIMCRHWDSCHRDSRSPPWLKYQWACLCSRCVCALVYLHGRISPYAA